MASFSVNRIQNFTEMDRDSPAAKNQRLADASDPEASTSPAATNGHLSPASQDSSVPGPSVHDTSADSRMSGSQVDGQLDDDILAEAHGSTDSHIRSSPERPKGPVGPEVAQESDRVEPEKSKAPETSAVDAGAAAFERNSIYHVKWIGWRRNGNDAPRRVGVVTQNENGPCPLLSIVNVLILRGKLTLPDGCEVISAEHLLEFLGKSFKLLFPHLFCPVHFQCILCFKWLLNY